MVNQQIDNIVRRIITFLKTITFILKDITKVESLHKLNFNIGFYPPLIVKKVVLPGSAANLKKN